MPSEWLSLWALFCVLRYTGALSPSQRMSLPSLSYRFIYHLEAPRLFLYFRCAFSMQTEWWQRISSLEASPTGHRHPEPNGVDFFNNIKIKYFMVSGFYIFLAHQNSMKTIFFSSSSRFDCWARRDQGRGRGSLAFIRFCVFFIFNLEYSILLLGFWF